MTRPPFLIHWKLFGNYGLLRSSRRSIDFRIDFVTAVAPRFFWAGIPHHLSLKSLTYANKIPRHTCNKKSEIKEQESRKVQRYKWH